VHVHGVLLRVVSIGTRIRLSGLATLLAELGERYANALAEHRRVLRQAAEPNGILMGGTLPCSGGGGGRM